MDLLEATFRAENTHFWFRGLVQFSEPLIQHALAGIAHPRILDCGCGTGANLRRLSKYGSAIGFDISASGLQMARCYQQHRLARASVTHIPFAGASFDLATAFDVLACLDDRTQQLALREMRRVLRPGGALLLNTAALPFLKGQHAVFGHEVHRTTRRRLRGALGEAGFRVERITYTNFSVFPLVLPVRLLQRFVGLSTPEETGVDIAVPPRLVNATLSILLDLESKALRVANMPIGSSLLALARC